MIKRAKKKILLAILLCLSVISYAQNNVIDEIIWVVGDEAILKSDVEDMRRDLISRGEQLKGDPYCFIPEQLAVQKLFLDQAKADSITIQSSTITREADYREKYYINAVGSKEKLEEYWRMPLSQIRERIREQIQNQYLTDEVKKKLTAKMSLTPSEVRKYYAQLPKDSLPFIQTTVEVQIITNEPVVPVTEVDKVKERLRDFTNRINSGEQNFSTLAIMYSEDGSSANGGELGFNGRAQWVPEFASMAFSLNDPKKVSNIVETEYGFHILQLIERRGDQVNVRHILLKPKVPGEAFDRSITRMDSLAKDIRAQKFTFEDATAISHDKDTRSNNGLMVNEGRESSNHGTPRFIMEELPPEVSKVVATMKVGDVSAPFKMILQKNGKEVVAIVKLRSRVEGHVANVSDDFQILKEIVEDRKQEEILKKWLQAKIKDTYVRIDKDWQNCDFQYSGWIK
ncbi:peptidylprolyl isomerase [Bacteroidia bacterium]|nr:peptidylprolyl isomerase [Bacteroidia bacterium]